MSKAIELPPTVAGDPNHCVGRTGADDQGGLVPIGEAAKRLGVCVATLRIWDRQGRLKPTRTLGGHRRYAVADLDRVRRGSEAAVPR